MDILDIEAKKDRMSVLRNSGLGIADDKSEERQNSTIKHQSDHARDNILDAAENTIPAPMRTSLFYSSKRPPFIPFLERLKIKKAREKQEKIEESFQDVDEDDDGGELNSSHRDLDMLDEESQDGYFLKGNDAATSKRNEQIHENGKGDLDNESATSDHEDNSEAITEDCKKRNHEDLLESKDGFVEQESNAKKRRVSPNRKVSQTTLTKFFTPGIKKVDTVIDSVVEPRNEGSEDEYQQNKVISEVSSTTRNKLCQEKDVLTRNKSRVTDKTGRREVVSEGIAKTSTQINGKFSKKRIVQKDNKSENFSLTDLVLGSSEFSELISDASGSGGSSPLISSGSEYNPSSGIFSSEISESPSSSRQTSPYQVTSIMDYFNSGKGGASKALIAKERLTPPTSPGWKSKVSSSQKNSPSGHKKVTASKNEQKGAKKMEQMYLDIGQRDFGHVTCQTCGMVYTCAQPEDEADHIRFHKKLVSGLKFTGWKTEHVLQQFHDGRIIVVLPEDNKLHLRKVAEVHQVVDSELGFIVDGSLSTADVKTYLFITNKKVVGCAVAKDIDRGNRVLPNNLNRSSEDSEDSVDRHLSAWCCSTTPEPAQCGISRIWVFSQMRRKKIATRLVDCVRNHFIFGCIIPKSALAFSDPTPDGKIFAQRYTGTREFLVFR